MHYIELHWRIAPLHQLPELLQTPAFYLDIGQTGFTFRWVHHLPISPPPPPPPPRRNCKDFSFLSRFPAGPSYFKLQITRQPESTLQSTLISERPSPSWPKKIISWTRMFLLLWVVAVLLYRFRGTATLGWVKTKTLNGYVKSSLVTISLDLISY